MCYVGNLKHGPKEILLKETEHGTKDIGMDNELEHGTT